MKYFWFVLFNLCCLCQARLVIDEHNFNPCEIPTILHGNVWHHGERIPGKSLMESGAVVELTCDEWYYVEGPSSSACIEHGWMPELGTCKPVDDIVNCGFRDSNPFGSQSGEYYPWLARLEVEFLGNHGISVCGATLIDPKWLLTSAHCLDRAPINGILITMGRNKFNVFVEPEYRRLNSSRNSVSIIYHPFYRNYSGTYTYDFALIKLRTGAFSSRPICLPDLPDNICQSAADISMSIARKGLNCEHFVSAGWGSTENTIPWTTRTVQRTEMNLTGFTEACDGDRLISLNRTAGFCAKPIRKHVCYGSPGVPLMCSISERYYLVGVFSYNPSYDCLGGPYKTYRRPDVYFRVCHVHYWIRLTLGDLLTSTTARTRPGSSRQPVVVTAAPTVKPTWRTIAGHLWPYGSRFIPELGEAAARGDIENIRRIVNSGANVNAVGYPVRYYPVACPWDWHWPNATALIWAAGCNRSYEVLVELLIQGADANMKDYHGMTALLAAAHHGNTKSVEILLDADADVEARNNVGDSPLSQAAFFGHLDTVELLLQRDAYVDSVNYLGETPLFQAAAGNSLEVAKLLLDHNADPAAQTVDGETALIRATKSNFVEMVKLNLEKGADANARDANGWTALLYADHGNFEEIIKLLIDYAADRRGCNHKLCKLCRGCNEDFYNPFAYQ